MTSVLRSTPAKARQIEVDGAVGLPVAFAGLRKILIALKEVAPEAMAAAADGHPSEWNRVFPGAVKGAPDLADLALTPSERRLHRESEQTFLVVNVAARAVLDALKESGSQLVVRHAGACDLVSLRCLMRAAEWGRLEGLADPMSLADWDVYPEHSASMFEGQRRASLATLRGRMRLPDVDSPANPRAVSRKLEPAVDAEGRFLLAAIDPQQVPEWRVAASILAIRAAFFTTNYEGALLAAEHGLAQLTALGGSLRHAEVLAGWDALSKEGTTVTPAIEIDRQSLGDRHELKALLHRCVGVVQVFTGLHEEALASFAAGLACEVSAETRGQLRMFRGLMLIKRLGQLENARSEILQGLQGLEERNDASAALHKGWLRNVLALSYFQEKKLDQAVAEEKEAIRCVGSLHDPSATHLKINLISNLSVVQETAKRYDEAILTWRRFEKISENWGVNFHKHHRFRLAGLTLGTGDRVGAAAWYREAYLSAEQLSDSLHRQDIAVELGRLMLDDGKHAEAQEWYARAVGHARDVGDPFRLAEGLAGEALAARLPVGQEIARVASLSSSYPAKVTKLLAAIEKGDPDGVKATLPSPRSKLNRPFDLVNL